MQIYKPTWNSLRTHRTPEWYRDAKFGIYTHWGIYCVPACGPNATWYPYNMYREGTQQYKHHVEVYGGPEKFGYKDFIPDLTGAKFDAEEWAELFAGAGAKFAGPVGEHHDGFSMWDSKINEWNSVKMGPKRDVCAELEKAYRAKGMKYMIAMHHAENWWFFPHWKKDCDVAEPRYSGLYGELHNTDGPLDVPNTFFNQDLANTAFLNQWRDRLYEVIDFYQPDLIWFDFALEAIAENYVQDFLTYYYNKEQEWKRDLMVTYKWNHIPPNVAVLDHELGREAEMTYHEWLTDSTVDDGEAWGYVKDAKYKSSAQLIHYLVDNVSKNGYLLLNVGPKADGSIPDEVKAVLKDMGKWLEINGEAIYGTNPWFKAEEGPTKLEKSGAFNEGKKPEYTPEDIRFTCKDNALYATCFGWPGESITITSVKGYRAYPGSIKSVKMLGSDEPLQFKQTDEGLVVSTPKQRPCEHAFVFKIERAGAYEVK